VAHARIKGVTVDVNHTDEERANLRAAGATTLTTVGGVVYADERIRKRRQRDGVRTMSCGFLGGAGVGDAGATGFTIFPCVVAVIGSIAPPALQPAPSARTAKVSASISEGDLIRPDSISVGSRLLKGRKPKRNVCEYYTAEAT
jgi:hypothetical protein